MKPKEINEFLNSLKIPELIQAVNRLAEAQEKANQIAERSNKLSEQNHQVNKRMLLEEQKKNKISVISEESGDFRDPQNYENFNEK